jgi:integrase
MSSPATRSSLRAIAEGLTSTRLFEQSDWLVEKSVARCAQDGGLHYRWHDCRHTFVSRLAENPAVSEQTIMALAGHVSKAMLARYSHIRSAAKQAAIATLEYHDCRRDGAQSNGENCEERSNTSENSLN